MTPFIPTLLTFALATALHAQDLAPELAPLVAKHQADLAALDAQKAAATTRAQQPYVSALDGAEKTATTAGALEVVAAISKEREALKSGLMAPAFPEGLPKNPHSYLELFLGVGGNVTLPSLPGIFLSLAAQSQVAGFFASDGTTVPNMNDIFPGPFFEIPSTLPNDLGYTLQ